MSRLTTDGTLLFGIEFNGQMHKDFTMRVPTLEDVEAAIEDAGPDASNARMNRHKWSRTITRLGEIPADAITAELLAGLPAPEYGVLLAVEDELAKKLLASSAESSAASAR